MSAIWGCVDLSGEPLPEELGERMRGPLRKYKIDRFEIKRLENAVFGCGLQYIHKHSEAEPLPVYDRSEGLLFTADCIIDNRREVAAGLGLPAAKEVPDGALMSLAYSCWREDAPKHVIGSYSFAAYDEKKRELVLSADHTFSRSIYWSRRGAQVYFSTLMEPVLQGLGGAPELDETYVAWYLSMPTLATLRDHIRTPFAGISRVAAGSYIRFDAAHERETAYWRPEDARPAPRETDEQCRARFVALMEKVTGQMLHTSGEVAIQQSGGFDSCAVASFAAPLLAEQGKKLYAHTYVPLEGFVSKYSPKYCTTDERPFVKSLCRMYPNIEARFMSFPDTDGFRQMPRLLDALEAPYKSYLNIAWLNEMESAAAERGCRVMLNGQFGNGTISAGSVYTYVKTRLKAGRFIDGFSTLNRYCLQKGLSRRFVFRYMAGEAFLPDAFRLARAARENPFKDSFVNLDFARRLGIDKELGRSPDEGIASNELTYKQELKLTYNLKPFAQISDSETKMGLLNGLVIRDPTKDIRIIEFCMGLPMERKVNAVPQTRRLCRVYLADRLPREILPENTPRGRQSLDWPERIAPRWNELYPELEQVCRSPILRRFVDGDKLEAHLSRFRNPPGFEDDVDFYRFTAVYELGLFLLGREWANF